MQDNHLPSAIAVCGSRKLLGLFANYWELLCKGRTNSLLSARHRACECPSTLAVVRRETGTWRWPLFLFVYTTGLAWLVSVAVFQLGRTV